MRETVGENLGHRCNAGIRLAPHPTFNLSVNFRRRHMSLKDWGRLTTNETACPIPVTDGYKSLAGNLTDEFSGCCIGIFATQ